MAVAQKERLREQTELDRKYACDILVVLMDAN